MEGETLRVRADVTLGAGDPHFFNFQTTRPTRNSFFCLEIAFYFNDEKTRCQENKGETEKEEENKGEKSDEGEFDGFGCGMLAKREKIPVASKTRKN